MFNKKGVSLITVLLFMLVATIAATATFKWLTSENKSSASRMLGQEAYQSSLAGIEDVRAWMSGHGNEVGAIIKQYLAENKPILLNSHSLNRDGQQDSVWLTAVDTTQPGVFKLQLLSKGNSRNESSNTLAAILNVSGLYRVGIPEDILPPLAFNKAFHGGSEGITGDDTIGSGNINGDWTYSNNPVIRGDMIVTGMAEYGANMNHYGDFYLAKGLVNKAGSTTYGTAGVDTTVVYIGENVECPNGQPITVYGDLYVKGNISEKCKVYVSKNFTLGGRIVRENDYSVYVGKNWVFTKKVEEQLDLTKYVNNNTNFTVGKNLYLPYKIKAHCSDFTNCGDTYGKRGFNVGGKVYQYVSSPFVITTQDGHSVDGLGSMSYGAYMDNYTRPFAGKEYCSDDAINCKRGRLFSFNAEEVPSERVYSWSPSDNVLKDVGDQYWAKINKLTQYGKMIKETTKTIPQPIMLKDSATWMNAKANLYCKIGDDVASNYVKYNFTKANVDSLNSCYKRALKDKKLYNGFLVMEWKYSEIESENVTPLEGHFVFFATDPAGNVKLPPTTSESIVMLYLAQGTKTGAQLSGNKSLGLTYNYLIFAKEDIAEINQLHVTGSVVMADGKKLLKYQGGCHLEFNNAVLDSLISSGIIKENPEYRALVNGEEAVDDEFIIGKAVHYDPNYIAISPQLGITLESQYKTTESVSSATEVANIDPSILVLPRVIYLSKDAPGRLVDYYSVLNLNGATETKTAGRVGNCEGPGAIPTTSVLYDGDEDHLLTPGIYNCVYNSEHNGSSPFYIVVNNTVGEVPIVKFKPPKEQALNLNDAVTVSVHVGKSTKSFSFFVSMEGSYPGWTITPKAGVVEQSGVGDKRYFKVSVPAQNAERDVDIFTISTDEYSEDGDMYMALVPPTEGCQLSSNMDENTHHVYVKARTNIYRRSLEEFCYSYSTGNSICGDDMLSRPDCDYYDNEWVTAVGTGCRTLVTNDGWRCLTTSPISLASVYASEIPPECEIVIPSGSNNKISSPVGGTDDKLYASLKRKKVELTVSTKFTQDANTYVRVREKDFSLDETCAAGHTCTFRVYAGTPIILSYEEYGDDKNNFRYWSCSGDNCPNSTITEKETELTLYGSHSVTAVFNKEYLCYYEDFTKTSAFCGAYGEDCIDTCAIALEGTQACMPKNSKQPKSKWLMTYHNKGTGDNATYARPTFGTSGSIYASSSQDKPSVILRNKNVGLFGTMNALVQTGIIDKSNSSDLLNSGLVFRSNGSEHLILNIYGTNKPGNSGELTFRVCKVQGQSIKNTTEGDCKLVESNESTPLSITNRSFIKVRFVIDENDLLKITAQTGDINDKKIWNGELNVSAFSCNSNLHAYAGISLADPDFKVFENLWISSLLDEVCSEVPSIKCQFRDYNHVPIDTDVLPEVTVVNGGSDWFTEKSCIMDYYYNGCDNTTTDNSSFCSTSKDLGQLDSLGAKIATGDQYHFTEAGDHGNRYGDKKRWEASVKVVCPGDQTSLDLAQDYYSCHFFHVGDTATCSKDVEIYNESQYLTANVPYEFLVPNGKANMRSAELHIDIDIGGKKKEKELGASLKVQLQSSNGMRSSIRTIDKTGGENININDVNDGSTGFDPEEVTKVIITSDNNININKLHIRSHCGNKLELKCAEEANYTYSQGWEIKINHQEPEVKCTYKSTDPNIEFEEDVTCSDKMFLTYKKGYGYNWFDPSNTTPSFTVVVKRKNASDSCSIPGVKLGNNLNCSIPAGQENIPYGTGAPTFSSKFGQTMAGPGWNGFNINYQITLTTPTATDSVVKEGTIKMGELLTYRYPEEVPASGDYKYKVNYTIGAWSSPCEAGFTIQDKEKTPPTLDCSKSYVENNGKFTAFVENPDNLNFTCTFSTEIVLDNLGHTQAVDGHTASGSGEDPLYYTYAPGKAGTYYYTAQIGESKCIFERSVESPIDLECPSIITDQNASDPIVVEPKIKNCEDCSYKIFDGDLEKSTDLVFYDNSGTGTKQYKLEATDKNENVASCPFYVTFKSQQSGTVVELPYNGEYKTFGVGIHTIKCTPNNGQRGKLVCECPVTQYDYNNCVIKYNGYQRDPFMYNTAVDGDPLCGSADQVTLEVLSPLTGTGLKEQPSGIKCKHAW